LQASVARNAMEPVKPRQCVLAFTFPVTEREFFTETGTASREFLRKFEYWQRFYEELVRPYNLVMPEVTRLGAAIRCNVTLDQFASFFEDDSFRVVILFAHWKGEGLQASRTDGCLTSNSESVDYTGEGRHADRFRRDGFCAESPSAVEFFDRFWPIPDIVARVPSEFEETLDLCVCHPNALVAALHRDRPRCLVKYVDTPVAPSRWLYFYLTLFKLLTEKDIDYTHALTATFTLFSRNSNQDCGRLRSKPPA